MSVVAVAELWDISGSVVEDETVAVLVRIGSA